MLVLCFQAVQGFSIGTDSSSSFSMGIEYRPRIEYRNGYRHLRDDTTSAAYFGTHRCRLLFDYSSKVIRLHSSLQDVRVWGEYGLTPIDGGLGVFEAYADLKLADSLYMRVGRQAVEEDNGRLISAANWLQQSRAHDGLRLTYADKSLSMKLMGFFNQSGHPYYGTSYNPPVPSTYKLLVVHALTLKASDDLRLYLLNIADGHQSTFDDRVLYVRGTSGGRIEYSRSAVYATVCGYFQYGHLTTGGTIAAYYVQPEISYRWKDLSLQLGLEHMSGDDAFNRSAVSHSFVPLYGVTWKFMGNMDYFVSFPSDVRGGGLVNPYVFMSHALSPTLSITADGHSFFLQNSVATSTMAPIKSYLGSELDVSCRYKVNKFTTLQAGLSVMSPSQNLAELRGGDAGRLPVWSYAMVTISPTVLEYGAAK